MATDKETQKRIDRAIANREKSIAYFNSLNAAISLLAASSKEGQILDPKAFIKEWRDTFYEMWQEWYLENMAEAPKTYKPQLDEMAEAKKEQLIREGVKFEPSSDINQ